MGILISVRDLEKTFGAQTLFSNLSFGIESGQRVGLIGPNGAGKSTLMKILAGESDSDGGEVIRSRGLKVGYLAQSPTFPPGATVYEAVAEGAGEDYDRLGEVAEWIARLNLGGSQVGESEEGKAVNEETLVDSLSGGWKKRVALARELVRGPDLLLLDEPTNHLDLETILWLENFLQTAPFATLTVTHDRMFLQRVANRIFDLDKKLPGGLLVIEGSYADYLEAKDVIIQGQMRREESVKNTLRRETEWLRRGAKARTTKSQSRIDRAGDLKDEAEDLNSRNLNRVAKIEFQSADRHPQRLIEAIEMVKEYDGRRIFGPLDLLIGPKTRLGLMGPNGSGKSTLIRTLLGEEEPSTGIVKRAEKLKVAYFAQTRQNELNPKSTVLQAVIPDGGDYVSYRGSPVFGRSYLNRFLFRNEQMDMPLEKLSGGEKARLRVAQLMLEAANVLVLDEPTNDLDMATLAVLEESLRDFDGAVILVTHDRYFLDQVANKIMAFTRDADGQPALETFADTLQWEEWQTEQQLLERTRISKAKAAEREKAGGKKKKLTFKDQFELDNMEETIAKTEARLQELRTESQNPSLASNASKLADLFAEMAQVEKKIEGLYSRWSELSQ